MVMFPMTLDDLCVAITGEDRNFKLDMNVDHNKS